MAKTRKLKIEIFSAGCPTCEEAIKLVQSLACESCDIQVLDMNARGVTASAKKYGVQRLPAVVIEGKPAECCATRGVDPKTLRAAGVGVSM